MVQITDKKHWVVEVPDGAKLLHIEVDLDGKPYLAYKFKDDELLNEYELTYLDTGSWQYLFTTKGCTEEDARKVVEQRGKSYRDYERTFNFIPLSVFTAIESLQSLLRSIGCDINKNWAIIQKQNDNATE